MADRVTRASNANAHPGMVDRGHQRRSKQEVEMARQAKAAAKLQAKQQKADNIQRVAELERVAKRKMRDMDKQANDPIDKITCPRMKQTRAQPGTGNIGITHIVWTTD